MKALWILPLSAAMSLFAVTTPPPGPPAMFRQYCTQCHGKAAATAGINLEQLTAQKSVGENFQHWQKVAKALEEKRMPPPKMRQPTDTQRTEAVSWIRAKLTDFAAKHAGDPGKVTVRRLTSGEYAYAIQDLTGLDLKFDRDFATDSVGGEGFTNFGDVQFMADANLERYLEAAKRIADHAVIGAGPLQFYSDPGRSGFELSAIRRIQKIYADHGFRANSGEGGRPYGLDKYSKAFYVAWRYRNRASFGEADARLEDIATREGVSVRFAQHIWSLVQQPDLTYPTSEAVARWKKLPAANGPESDKAARAACDEIRKFVTDWPRWLFAAGALAMGGQGDERSIVLTDASLQPTAKHKFRFPMRGRGQTKAKVFISVTSANPTHKENTIVVWRNPMVRMFGADRSLNEPKPLKSLLDEETAKKLVFGRRPDGVEIGPDDFATVSDVPFSFEIPTPKNAGGMLLLADAEIGAGQSGNAVLRVTLSNTEEVMRGTPAWALLGDPDSPGFKSWKKGVLDFAAALPLNSQGEATPSDKDPIPAPYDNTYNQPERDQFHTKVKYYRTDRFLVDHILDDGTRAKLDHAWNDLLASFDYHDTILRFIGEKYKLELKKKRIADYTEADFEALPAEPRQYAKALRVEYDAVRKAELASHPGHVKDCLEFASKAWRRPLTPVEKDRLRAFYVKSTEEFKLEHGKAIEALLARVLIAPAFLYRLEQPAPGSGVKGLSDWELASRLSLFLWSSLPDEELRRAAAAGELSKPDQLEKQVKRMLSNPKSERLATEFFGQWLGFYRFDQYRGVDTKRFPEFTEEVKAGMYDEAVSFFQHIIQKDRPVREIFDANYTFLTKALAKHYGVKKEIKSTTGPELVEGASEFHRGGLLRMGAVLTATSAPLRTSPVKRGDWVLRRILGTPTPPPPPDAGSIPADDKSFGGLTVFERLEAHKRNPTCASCHTRIDPLGFPLERYDAVGRWRETYSDGKPVHDSAALADNTPVAGVDGLVNYLKTQQGQVLQTMSHKLIGYALGRTVLASDQALIDRLTQAGGDVTFSKLVTEIVTSKQFRYRRERNDAPVSGPQQSSVTPARKKSDSKVGGL